MLPTVPTGAHNPNSHTATTITEAIQGRHGARRWTFRYELLDSANATVTEALDCVIGGAVTQNWLADIKRTASFVIADTGDIDYLSDRIRPWVRLHLPPYGDDDWCEWPKGVFLLSSPSRAAAPDGLVTRSVQAYDQLQILADDKVSDRYAVDAGTFYTTAVRTLLTSAGISAGFSYGTGPVLAAAREWDPGTSKLQIVNDLLAAINYNSMSFDGLGEAQVTPYVVPSDRGTEWTYADGQSSLTVPGVDQELDLFAVPNKWVLVVTEADRVALSGSYTNSDPGSPTSTVNRARTIVDFRTEQEAPDQATLDAKAYRLAFEASQVYEKIRFTTGINPLHDGNDVYRITHASLAVDAPYVEHEWSMPLSAGATMSHTARRIVAVG